MVVELVLNNFSVKNDTNGGSAGLCRFSRNAHGKLLNGFKLNF